jgi:hypothetical protein
MRTFLQKAAKYTYSRKKGQKNSALSSLTEEAVAGQKKENSTLTFYTERYRRTEITRQE